MPAAVPLSLLTWGASWLEAEPRPCRALVPAQAGGQDTLTVLAIGSRVPSSVRVYIVVMAAAPRPTWWQPPPPGLARVRVRSGRPGNRRTDD